MTKCPLCKWTPLETWDTFDEVKIVVDMIESDTGHEEKGAMIFYICPKCGVLFKPKR